MRKLVFACLVLTTLGSGSQAFAWSCVAVASDGGYGYSYNWPSEQDAELTALNQCEAHSTSGDCSTESCDPNG